MSHEIVIPRLGWSMEQGTFVAWLKHDGDSVQVGDPLFELEGEKASQEIESIDAGILRIPPTAPQPGDTVDVGTVIGYLTAEGEAAPWTTAAASPAAVSPPSAETPKSQPKHPAEQVAANGGNPATTSAIASPRARRVAKELGVDWTKLSGTGAQGRVREQDVRSATPAPTRDRVPSPGTSIPVTAKRRVIAERLTASHQQTVPVTLHTTVDATNLVNLREQFKSRGDVTVIPSYQDILTKLVAAMLERHLLLAGRWEQHAIVLPSTADLNIGMAVHTDDGLVVPVIKDVLHLSLSELANRSKSLVTKARSGQLTASEMQGGVFTLTNLGSLGVEHFTPIINLPETAILGIGTIRREAVVAETGEIVARDQLRLSLTFDHRSIDGTPAGKFLQDLTTAILNPSAWLID